MDSSFYGKFRRKSKAVKLEIEKKKFILILLALILFGIVSKMYYDAREIQIEHIFAIIVLFIIAGYCIIEGLKLDYIINPFLLFAIVPISLLMYDLSVSTHYLVELRSDTYWLSIYNMLMFLMGMWLSKHLETRFSSLWNSSCEISDGNASHSAYIFMAVGLVPSIYGCIFGFGHLLSGNLYALKETVNAAPLASIFSLFLYIGVMFALYSKRVRTITFCVIALLFSMIINFSKTTVVMMCICIIVHIYDLTKENAKIKKWFTIILAGALVLFLASFTIYNNLRFDYDINDYFGELGYVGDISAQWFLPVMYLISPWGNLQYIVDTTTELSHGLWILKPVLGYLQLDGIWASVYELVPRYSAFNTYTYISVLYRDFGFWGSGIASFFMGMFVMRIFKMKMLYFDSPYIKAVYALNAYAVAMLFFNNHYFQLSYPFTIYIISAFLVRVVRK